MKPDPSTVALHSPKGQQRADRIQARIDFLSGPNVTGWEANALRSSLAWVLGRLATVERELTSHRSSELIDDGCELCRELPTQTPKGHRYLRSGHPGLGGVVYVHSSKCSCGTSENETIGLRQNCASCRRRREVEQARTLGELEPRGHISQAQAVAIIEAYIRAGEKTAGDLDAPVLDGLDLEDLGIQ